MNHIIYLWLMIAPGVWDKQELHFDTYEECHQATHILMDRTNKFSYTRLIDLLKTDYPPKEGSGFMFVDKC